MKAALLFRAQKFRATPSGFVPLGFVPLVALTLAAAANATVAPAAKAALLYDVTFAQPDLCGALRAGLCDQVVSSTQSAGQLWSNAIQGDATLKVVIRFDDLIPRATGRSLTTSFVTTTGGLNVFEQGAASKIRTGIDANGALPDIEFNLNTAYLTNELAFGTDAASIPTDKTDALSIFLHEFGHAFAFNGFRNPVAPGTLADNFESTFDAQTTFDGTNYFFNGAQSNALYGGPIALTYGNIFHLGNAATRPGSDLIPDLMNGVQFDRGKRYSISALDLAILQDTGIATRPIESVPTPPLLLSTLIFGWFAKRKKDRLERAAAVKSQS
jgi:hypothetical protein